MIVATYLPTVFTLQNGLQPIHLATCLGHLNVVSTLIENFGIDPQETSDVCVYVHAVCMILCSFVCMYICMIYICM